MIDIHTHILPGVDDGSPDLETSLHQLRLMQAAGITEVFLTPHYLRPAYQNPLELITAKIAELKEAVSSEKIEIKLHRGAEIYLEADIIELIESEQLTLGGTEYVLVETNMTSFPTNFLQILYDLVRSGFKPILAHPERYLEIIIRPKLAEDIIHRNVYLQLNSGSLLGHFGSEIQKLAWKLVERGHAHFLASDNHCRFAEFNYHLAVDLIRKNLDDFTADLLSLHNPAKIFKAEQIDYFYVDSITENKKSFLSRLLGR